LVGLAPRGGVVLEQHASLGGAGEIAGLAGIAAIDLGFAVAQRLAPCLGKRDQLGRAETEAAFLVADLMREQPSPRASSMKKMRLSCTASTELAISTSLRAAASESEADFIKRRPMGCQGMLMRGGDIDRRPGAKCQECDGKGGLNGEQPNPGRRIYGPRFESCEASGRVPQARYDLAASALIQHRRPHGGTRQLGVTAGTQPRGRPFFQEKSET
jgi:hypothetical protein